MKLLSSERAKEAFQKIGAFFHSYAMLTKIVPMIGFSRNSEIKPEFFIGVGVNAFAIGEIGIRSITNTNTRLGFWNANGFRVYPLETK